jgi:hypothetical protein
MEVDVVQCTQEEWHEKIKALEKTPKISISEVPHEFVIPCGHCHGTGQVKIPVEKAS